MASEIGMTYSVLLADDHPLLLRGLTDLLSAESDFSVVASTSSGVKALSLIRKLHPNLAVLDVSMPDLNGLEILETVNKENLPVKVVFLTAMLTPEETAKALALSIHGMLLKEYASDTLLDCLRLVAAGGRWLPDELLKKASKAPVDHDELAELTPRELEISELICGGLSNRAIAKKLGISDGTIGIHLHNIYRKLDISSRTALAAVYIRRQSSKNRTYR